jgi:FtsP/CotA-like multicopper oxidase with cupredoxin domain
MPRGAARFTLTFLLLASGVSAQQPVAKPQYSLAPTPKTIAWGYYDASTPPVLRVKSGDTVEVQTLITSSPKRLEGAGLPANQVEQAHSYRTDLH